MPALEQARSTVIAAAPSAVRRCVLDFHAWTKCSLWEELFKAVAEARP